MGCRLAGYATRQGVGGGVVRAALALDNGARLPAQNGRSLPPPRAPFFRLENLVRFELAASTSGGEKE